MASITFHGAAQQVTGSCYLIETQQHRILLECGIRQGSDRRENEYEQPFDFDPASIDAVVISHAHLDHSGQVPLLVKRGFNGPVFASTVTQGLLPIMYRDAASLLRSDYERKNRRLLRAGKEEVEPPYTFEDVDQALEAIKGIDYGRTEQILPDIKIRFRDAGHILGSSTVELWLSDGGQERKLVFSGDLGNHCAPLLSDPEIIREADLLLLESTYGDRNHRPLDDTLDEFREVIETASGSGGKILIPAFAVGRTQDLIYWLGQMYHEGRLGSQQVFIDSPMAIKVSDVYERYHNLFNQDDPRFRKFMTQGWENWLPALTYTESVEDSMALNRIKEGAIIIAGSGMCTGGRILHHFKHNIWNRKTQVIIVGYQAEGTLGRKLVNGASMIRIYGEDIAVKAQIHTLGSFSAHAGQDQLIEWASHFESAPRTYLVHGEPDAMRALQRRIGDELQWDVTIPEMGEIVTL